jgi:hypothetical protein
MSARTWEFRGQHHTLLELAKLPECRVKPKTLENRLRSKWPVERAMTEGRNSKTQAGRKGRLSPYSACSVVPAGETMNRSVR